MVLPDRLDDLQLQVHPPEAVAAALIGAGLVRFDDDGRPVLTPLGVAVALAARPAPPVIPPPSPPDAAGWEVMA